MSRTNLVEPVDPPVDQPSTSADRVPEMAASPTTDDDRRLVRRARLAGALYLAIFVIGPFAFFYVPGELVVDGEAATTASNIATSTGLFQAGMIAETLIVAIEILLAGLLYTLLRPVDAALSLSAAFARLAEAMVQAVNVLIAGAILLVVGGTSLVALQPGEIDTVTGFLVDARGFGVMLWGLLFGFHLAMLGVLVRRSGFWPRWIGSLLVVASAGYLAQSYAHIVDTDLDAAFETVVVVMAVPGELAFTVWLLWKGIDPQRWRRVAARSA